jgi:hypothetical protein
MNNLIIALMAVVAGVVGIMIALSQDPLEEE